MKRMALSMMLALTGAAAMAGEGDRPASVELSKYRLVKGPIEIAGVRNNASGLTYSPVTKTLFLAVNAPTEVVELGLDGSVKRTIDLAGFSDTEGIAHVEGDTFAIIEEGRRNICLVEIGAATRSVSHNAVKRILVDPAPAGNVGLEGICYDGRSKRFYVVKEKHPRRIYLVKPPDAAGAGAEVARPWDIEKKSLAMDDLSGILHVAATGKLLVLSDDSKCVVECSTSGVEVSRLSLRRGSAGLKRTIPQPEGIAMDSAGRLYIASEPNLLYIFEKK